MNKAQLRHILRQRRAAVIDKTGKAEKIAQTVAQMQEFQQAKTVALYYSIGDEVATGPLLRLCLGKQICFPAVTGPGEMEFRMFRQDRMTIGPLAKIPEPDSTCPAVPVEAIDFFVVPGLGFDGSGARIGYGGGFYDRILANLQPHQTVCALAFEEQMMDQIPVECHDQKVGCLVTEGGVQRR